MCTILYVFVEIVLDKYSSFIYLKLYLTLELKSVMPRPKKDLTPDSSSVQQAKAPETSTSHRMPTLAFSMTTRRKAAAMTAHEGNPSESPPPAQPSSSSQPQIIVPRHLDLPASTPESSISTEHRESRGRKRNAESNVSSQPTPPKVLATSHSELSEDLAVNRVVQLSEQSDQQQSTSRSFPAKRLSSVEFIEHLPPLTFSPSQPIPITIDLSSQSQDVHRSISSTPDEHHELLFSPQSIGEQSTDIDEEEQAALEAEQADADEEEPSTPAPIPSSSDEDVGELGELPEDEQDDDVSVSPDFTLDRSSKPTAAMYSIILKLVYYI